MSIKERVKQGVITLDQALAEIAEGNRGFKRSKAARWVMKQVKPKKVRKKVAVKVDEPTRIKPLPLTLEECMQARAEFRPMPAMTPKAHTTLIGHMNKWIDHLKAKRKYTN